MNRERHGDLRFSHILELKEKGGKRKESIWKTMEDYR
jgi:hypothetical protein